MSSTAVEATGRRKTSVCRVHLKIGSGKTLVNKSEPLVYLKRQSLVDLSQRPLVTTETMGKVDITCKVSGGGLSGQAGAISLAIARALIKLDADLQPKLRKEGYLTRDAREVERKKYGQPKARKKFQFSKR